MPQDKIIEWIVYGLASTLTLTLGVVGFLVIYTMRSLKDSVATVKDACDELTQSFTVLVNEFKVSQALTSKQFEYERKSIEKLETCCKDLQHDVDSLKANDTNIILKMSKIESKIGLLERTN